MQCVNDDTQSNTTSFRSNALLTMHSVTHQLCYTLCNTTNLPGLWRFTTVGNQCNAPIMRHNVIVIESLSFLKTRQADNISIIVLQF